MNRMQAWLEHKGPFPTPWEWVKVAGRWTPVEVLTPTPTPRTVVHNSTPPRRIS